MSQLSSIGGDAAEGIQRRGVGPGMDLLTRRGTLGEGLGVRLFNLDRGGWLLFGHTLSFRRGGLGGHRGFSLALRWRHTYFDERLYAFPSVNNRYDAVFDDFGDALGRAGLADFQSAEF